MPRIFISYRRQDSKAIADRIFDRMEQFAGEGNVFQDVEKIPVGVDFRDYLYREIEKCDVVLVIIGTNWLTITDKHGRRRLDKLSDFVRIEVEAAFNLDKIVIPVLVDDTSMPDEDALPESLSGLCYRNAAIVRHNPDFRRDMDRLIRAIEDQTKGNTTSSKIYSNRIKTFVPPDLSSILPPPFEWCEIPEGITLIEDARDRGGTGWGIFHVQRFYIAKYPITNSQYRVFRDSESGYKNSTWWRFQKEIYFWRNTFPKMLVLPSNDFPCVSIAWYEAIAFCHWLTAQIRTTPSVKFALPVEQQWQRAARGNDYRIYPWGNQFDQNRCNTRESNLGKSTPVTRYLNGASSYGVMDMVGNIWEWCMNKWGTSSTRLTGFADRVIRGGSWDEYADLACTSYRNSLPPYARNVNVGFRIICRLALKNY